MNNRKLNLLMDFYELTMSYGYFKDNRHLDTAVFDVFFRSVPDRGGYAIMAGLEQVIDYINELSFDESEIALLRNKKIFNEDFLSYLKDFKFTADIYSVKEGTPIFPLTPAI